MKRTALASLALALMLTHSALAQDAFTPADIQEQMLYQRALSRSGRRRCSIHCR
jgi:hypothetical protein